MNKKARIIAPICIIFSILYIIFAAAPFSKELQFVPVWTIDIENNQFWNSEENLDFTDAIPFKMGQTLGYITPDGKILNKVSYPYKASVCRNFYTVYGTSSESIDFYSPDGQKAGTISDTGFPYFSDNKKYIFLPGGASFAMLNEDGSQKWKYEASTPVTAFSASASGTVAGFADGSVTAFNDEGEITQQYKPGGSTWEVILGAGISSSSKYVATLSGQDSQRFVISEKLSKNSGSNASIIFYKTLKEELNRQVIVKFSNDEKNVYYSCASGIGVVNIPDLKDEVIPIKGRVLSILQAESGREVFVLSKENDLYTVSVIEGFDVLAGSFSFKASSACLASSGDAIYVGRDTKISKIKIERK